MAKFTKEELREIIKKGWVMFDLCCKPTGKTNTTFRDEKTGMYYNPGSGWTKINTFNNFVLPIDPSKRTMIRMAMMTDNKDFKDGNIYFFASFLNIDREEWNMIGIYSFKQDRNYTSTVIESYIMENSLWKLVSLDKLVESLLGEAYSNIPMYMVSRNVKSLPMMNDTTANMFLAALGKFWTFHPADMETKSGLVNTAFTGGMIDMPKSTLKEMMWILNTSLLIESSVYGIAISLTIYGLDNALVHLVHAKGDLWLDQDTELSHLATNTKLIKFDQFFAALGNEVKEKLSMSSLLRLLDVLEIHHGTTMFDAFLNTIEKSQKEINSSAGSCIRYVYDKSKRGMKLSDILESYDNR